MMEDKLVSQMSDIDFQSDDDGGLSTLVFPGPLMSNKMQKEDLMEFIQGKVKECLQHSENPEQMEDYLFWKIMDLFCCRNGNVMMDQVATVLFKGYSLFRMKIKTTKTLKWVIHLAKLLWSNVPDVEHRAAVIKMGDDLASKGLMYAAHVCYVVARVELGTGDHFELIGCNSVPVGMTALGDARMRTEVYEYVLSLTSGLAQPNFQIFKLSYVSRLAMFEMHEEALSYCETIARAVFSFPDRIKRSFIERLLSMSNKLHNIVSEEEKPMWLLELSQMCSLKLADANTNADRKQQQTKSTISEVKEFQDSEYPDEIPVFQPYCQEWQTDPEDQLPARYTVEELLGQGCFGSVYAGIRKRDGKRVAIKCVKGPFETLRIRGEMCKLPVEVALMKLVSKPPHCTNVLRLLDWFRTPNKIHMVMERPSPCMDLEKFIELHNGCLSEAMAREIMLQVIQAVRHCRDRGVVHSDIKVDNLLINTNTMEVKLIDFGCGALLKDEPFTLFPGTDHLCPPECAMDSIYKGIPATVWGLGILLYTLVCKDNPFDYWFGSEVDTWSVPFPPHVSRDCRDLVMWCLELNPECRPSLEDLIRHEWFTEGV